MSQKAVFIRVNGNLYSEVLTHMPDHEDCIQICKDFGYDASDEWSNGNLDSADIEIEWCEISEVNKESGESNSDYFLDDESLCHLYDCYDWSESFGCAGYECESVQEDSDTVLFSELEEEW